MHTDIKTYVAEVVLLTFFLNITVLILGKLVSMLASNAVDCELEPLWNQTKDYKIGSHSPLGTDH